LIVTKREAGLAWNSVRNLICPLREMFNHAMDGGVLIASPAISSASSIRNRVQRQDTNPLTKEELRLYLDTARQHSPHAYPFLLALTRAGLRLGEALAL
jgi:integrase